MLYIKLTMNGISKIKMFLLLCLLAIDLQAQNLSEAKYQRGSVIHIMIEHPMYMFNDEIASAFKRIPLSERFNNHNLGVKVVKFATQEFTDQQNYISSFTKQTKLGNRAIAKWFNWDKGTGKFNMELIKERGLYNANTLDRLIASMSMRGNAILQDMGENLIPNTYLLMSDICYKGDYSNKEKDKDLIGKKRSFDVKITTYIYQLNWSEEQLYEFYGKYYGGSTDFINQPSYGFDYKAKIETSYGEKSSDITQSELIERVVARCLDINIAKLQKIYPDFRIKATMTSSDPIQADLGLKEGLTPNDKYEVLECEVDDDGIVTYKRVGIIKPVEGKIWDNRYMAAEENTEGSKLGYTTFEKVSGGDFYPGMIVREVEK